MRGAIHPLPQYAFIAWCSVKAQGQHYSVNLNLEFVVYVCLSSSVVLQYHFITIVAIILLHSDRVKIQVVISDASLLLMLRTFLPVRTLLSSCASDTVVR
jgi:hypothetical protein